MLAIVFEAPKKMKLKEIHDPIFGDFEALCLIESSAVCGATDRHIFNNNCNFNVSFPLVIGHEAIGRVISCGSKVRYLKKNDLVSRVNNRLPVDCGISLMWGGMAELGIVTDWRAMKENGLVEESWKKFTANRVLPSHFDSIASTMIITWRETLSFFKRLNFSKGEKIVIIGSGAVALSFVCHCNNYGIKTVVIGNPSRMEKFLYCGAGYFISYKERQMDSIIKSSTFFNVQGVIDACGDYKLLNKLVPILKNEINEIKVGLYGLNNDQNQSIFISKACGDIFFYSGLFYDEGSVHEEIINNISTGRLKSENFIGPSNIYSLNDYKNAFRDAWSGKSIKSVLNFLKK